MLNGIAPLLVFQFYEGTNVSDLEEIPTVKETPKLIGAPIPLYLEESITNIMVNEGGAEISISTDAQTDSKGKAKPKQRVISTTVNISMTGSADSLILNTILAMCNLISTKLVDQNYAVSYFHKSTIVVKGLLDSFRYEVVENTSKMNIFMTLSKANNPETDTKAEERSFVAPSLTGVTGSM